MPRKRWDREAGRYEVVPHHEGCPVALVFGDKCPPQSKCTCNGVARETQVR
jgi:hypothetical protein